MDYPVLRHHKGPFVERTDEQILLRQALWKVEHSSSGGSASPHCILLEGDAGIGKTRLAEEVCQEATQRGWSVLWSRAYRQEYGLAYSVWIQILRSTIQQGMWKPEEEDFPAVFASLLPELSITLSTYTSRPPLPTQRYPFHLYDALLDLLHALTRTAPLLIVLDDLHWADTSSCETFAYLIRHLSSVPLLFLGTFRHTEVHVQPALFLQSLLQHLQREQMIHVLHLGPLSNTAIAHIVSTLSPKAAPRLQHIQTQAAGNPFFAEELAHLSSDERLPKTITATLDARLTMLSPSCQRLLASVSIFGGAFTVIAALETIQNRQDEATLLSLLEEALQARILIEEGKGTHITYQFWHPLLADHLYQRLSATRRAKLHRRAAHHLRQIHANREHPYAATIIQHLLKGGASAEEIAHYAEMAAIHAYRLCAYPEAISHFQLALDQREQLHDQMGQQERQEHFLWLQHYLGECLRIVGDFEQAQGVYERAILLSQKVFDEEISSHAQIQASLWRERGWIWYVTGDLSQALICSQRGEHLLRQANISKGVVWARLRLQRAYIFWQEGLYQEATEAAMAALALLEEEQKQRSPQNDLPADPEQHYQVYEYHPSDIGRVHALLGAIANSEGKRTNALTHLYAAHRLFEEHDCRREVAHVSCNIGYAHLKQGAYQEAQYFFRHALDLAERIGDVPLQAVVFSNLGDLALTQAAPSEAERWFRRGITLAERINDRVYISLWKATLAIILASCGRFLEASRSLRVALHLARSMQNVPCIGHALIALATVRILQTPFIGEKPPLLSSRRKYALRRTHAILQKTLALKELETETRLEGLLTLAQIEFLLGESQNAQRRASSILEETRRYELVWLHSRCQALLALAWEQ